MTGQCREEEGSRADTEGKRQARWRRSETRLALEERWWDSERLAAARHSVQLKPPIKDHNTQEHYIFLNARSIILLTYNVRSSASFDHGYDFCSIHMQKKNGTETVRMLVSVWTSHRKCTFRNVHVVINHIKWSSNVSNGILTYG